MSTAAAPDHLHQPSAPCVLVYAGRERARTFARAVFPRRRGHTIAVRTAADFATAIRSSLVDAVIVDLAAPGDEGWSIAIRAPDFPSTPFFGLLPYRMSDAPALGRAAAAGVADVLHEQVDDAVAREIVVGQSYTTRFARALAVPPAQLALDAPAQLRAWEAIVSGAGRPITTSRLAATLGVTREHLSRNFARGTGANLKRVIDLVRLISAAELSKNPGYDVRDVATVLGFASSSHLAVTAQRIASARPASLASLRTVDLVERFTRGRTRSRVAVKQSL